MGRIGFFLDSFAESLFSRFAVTLLATAAFVAPLAVARRVAGIQSVVIKTPGCGDYVMLTKPATQIVRELDAEEIRQRLSELDRESQALRVLLRAAQRAGKRPIAEGGSA